MNWNSYIDEFLKERKSSSLSYYQFFNDTLEFGKKDKPDKWRSLSQQLKSWNEKYMSQYENISLYSPVIWNLSINISIFNITENIGNIKHWIYWSCLSSYINYGVSNELTLKIDENKLNPQEYFLKSKENMGIEVEEFLNNFDQIDLFEKDYIWINKETFLYELAQKRERSYNRLIAKLSNNEMEQEKYVSNILPMYEKYKRYEELFKKINVKKTELTIVEINPQGMNNLFDDCMCYIVRTEEQIYMLYLEDYA